jgi:hypothetical protein
MAHRNARATRKVRSAARAPGTLIAAHSAANFVTH